MEQVATKEAIKININKPIVERNVIMVVAFRGFRDEEYFVPKEIFQRAGVEVKTASTKLGIALGDEGGEAHVDFLISEVKPEKFDAVIFVGGPGCLQDLDNDDSYRLARETVFQKKILAAICIAPVILAKSGLLKEKKATVWASPLDKTSIKILEDHGAEYVDKNVVRDGRIITANGPSAAEEFAQKILENL